MTAVDEVRVSTSPAPQSRPRRPPAWRTPLGIFLLLAGIYGLAAGGHTYSSDEEGLFATTRTLVVDGDPTVVVSDDNNRVLPIRTGRTGEPVGVSGIGPSVVAVPLYLAGALVGTNLHGPYHDYAERVFVGWTNAIVTALAAVLLFLIARRVGADERWACILALVYGLGTWAFPHAKTFFSEPLATTLLLAATLFALKAAERPGVGRAKREPAPRLGRAKRGPGGGWGWGPVREVSICGLFAGAALLARISTGLFLPALGLYVFWTRAGSRRSWREGWVTPVAFAAGLVPPVGLLLLTNWWRWGSALDLGYESVPLDFPIAEGLYGLFLSPGKSVFLYAPVVAVGLGATFFAPRGRRVDIALFLAMAFVNALFFARFVHWHGDHSWGPRYLTMSLPFWILPIAPLLGRVRWRFAVLAAGAIGLVSAVLGTVMYFNQYFHIAEHEVGAVEMLPEGPSYWRGMHFDPYRSPIAGHVRALPDVVTNSLDRIDGRAEGLTAFPITTNDRYGWYFAPAQLDSWIYWIYATDGPRRLLPMAVGLLGSAITGGWLLRAPLRRPLRRRE